MMNCSEKYSSVPCEFDGFDWLRDDEMPLTAEGGEDQRRRAFSRLQGLASALEIHRIGVVQYPCFRYCSKFCIISSD